MDEQEQQAVAAVIPSIQDVLPQSPVTIDATGETEDLPCFDFQEKLPLEAETERVYGETHEDSTGTKWRLMWYPSGNESIKGNYTSCYLEIVLDDNEQEGAMTIDTSKEVEFTLGLIHPTDPSLSIVKVAEFHEFSHMSTDWGFKQFHELLSLNEFLFLDSETSQPYVTITARIQYLPQGSCWPGGLPYDYDSKKETGMVGLKNQGATCYMNSLLQTLYQLPKFRQAVYQTPTHDDNSTESVLLALQRVFYRLQCFDKPVSTKELTKSFGWGHYDSFTQHDVQELYRILCDRVEDKMKSTQVDNTVKELFEGKVRSFIRCVNVDFTSSRDESFYDLQLDVKGCKTIDDSFKKYIQVEMLQGENQYEAEGYGKQDAEKGLHFLTFPPVLNVHLKRFEYDPARDGMVKVHDRFEFPQRLDLTQYCKDPGDETNVYQLHSVLVHSGDVHGGHYYVYIRPPGTQDWFKFDDDRILKIESIEDSYGSSEMDEEDKKNVYGKRIRPLKSFSSAYMLVYVRESDFSSLMRPQVDIPASLVDRFQKEEEIAEKRRREVEIEHLSVTIKLATDSAIRSFSKITKHSDFVSFSTDCPKLRVEKKLTMVELQYQLQEQLHIPVSRQRLWLVITRENKTTRPDTPIGRKDAMLTLHHLAEEYPRKSSLLFYLEILPEVSSERRLKAFYLEDFTTPIPQVRKEELTEEDFQTPDIDPECILLFLKSFDPLETESQMLRYTGNMLVPKTWTGKQLQEYVASELGCTYDSLALFEEIQPSSIHKLDLKVTLDAAELQHGDIICYEKVTDQTASLLPLEAYFSYLVNRIEITFFNMKTPAENSLVLELSLKYTYSQVIQALANALGMEDPLYLRLYQHSTILNGPKSIPFSHKLFTEAQDSNELVDMLFDYTDRTTTLYYEVLSFPITEIESKRAFTIEPSKYFFDFESNTRETFLINPECQTLSDFFQQVRTFWKIPQDVELRLCELDLKGRTIVTYFTAEEKIADIPERSLNHWYLLEKIAADSSTELVSICHFEYQTPSTWVEKHSVPFLLPLPSEDTFDTFRDRLSHVLKQDADKIPLAVLKDDSVSFKLEGKGEEQVRSFLKEETGGGLIVIGMECPDPNTSRFAPRRQEQGIRIRPNS